QALQEAQRALQGAGDQPEPALAALAQAEQRLRSLLNAAAAGDAQALDALARALANTDAGRDAGSALNRGGAAAAAGALRKLARAGLLPEQRSQLADQLDRAAEQAAASGDQALAEALRRAAESQRSGDAQQQQAALDQLAREVQAQLARRAEQGEIQRALAA